MTWPLIREAYLMVVGRYPYDETRPIYPQMYVTYMNYVLKLRQEATDKDLAELRSKTEVETPTPEVTE